ncbi:hypothetical protein Tco_1479334, partial [Tanacetum coccineum]
MDEEENNEETTWETEDTYVIITAPINPKGQQQSSSVSSGFVSNMLNPSPDTVPTPQLLQAPPYKIFPTLALYSAVSSIPGIVDAYLANKMHEAVKTADQVKEQVKAQVSKILPKIEKTINEQLEAEALTRSSNESKTSHDVAANLSELELKKILIDKMESNKRRDDEDKDEEPSAGSNWGSKRRRAGKEPESTSLQKEKTSKTIGKSTEGSKSHHKSTGKSGQAKEPMHTAEDLEEPAHQEFTLPTAHGPVQPWLRTFAQKEDTHESFNELMDTPLDFSALVMNRLKVDTLTLELLAGPTFELIKGSCKSLPLPLIPNFRGHQVIPFDHFINKDLAYLSGGVSSQTYTTSVTKTKAADYGHIKWIKDLVPNRMESTHDVYSKCRIIVVTKLQIIEWHNYKNLDWITIRRDDDMLYKFKEGDFNRLRIQDIEDML